MSKYRWPIALLVLASALAVALLVPASALAAKPTSFEASGDAWIGGPFPTWVTGRVMHAADEPVNGAITWSPDWDALLDAGLETSHGGQIVLNPDGSFRGSLRGTFTLDAGGGNTLSGNMSGKVSGAISPVDYISDNGTWTSTAGTGDDFAKVKAGGTWEAYLEWTWLNEEQTIGTYVGFI